MPPVHIVLWGDPEVEYHEDEEINLAWEIEAARVNSRVTRVEDEDPEALRLALTAVIEDPLSQIVYLSCHGCPDGISYSRRGAILPFGNLSEWLHAMKPQVADGFADHGERMLILGFCESMDPLIRIEAMMPPWVACVAGFVGSPQAWDVAQLAAGFVLNLVDWVHQVLASVDRALGDNSSQPGVGDWRAMLAAVSSATRTVPDDPARGILLKDRQHVVIALRDPDSGQWARQCGLARR